MGFVEIDGERVHTSMIGEPIKDGCAHKWVVTTDEFNEPEDVMCDICKEVRIFVVNE